MKPNIYIFKTLLIFLFLFLIQPGILKTYSISSSIDENLNTIDSTIKTNSSGSSSDAEANKTTTDNTTSTTNIGKEVDVDNDTELEDNDDNDTGLEDNNDNDTELEDNDDNDTEFEDNDDNDTELEDNDDNDDLSENDGLNNKEFFADMNNDGVVDKFEKAVEKCIKEGNMNLDECQKKLKNFPRPKLDMNKKMDEFKKWKPDQFMGKIGDKDFMKEFDPMVLKGLKNNVLENFNPEFINELDTEKLKRVDPKIFEKIANKGIDKFDPKVFDEVKYFGKYIDPEIFSNVEDTKFFENFNPEFFNDVDVNKIPKEVLEKIDSSKFTELTPELFEYMKKNAPKKLDNVPDAVKKATELMMEDIPDELLKEYGFEGEMASKVQDLMKAVNNKKRQQIMPIFEKMDAEVQTGIMNLQDDFGSEVGDFMEYLPNVPEKMQEGFVEQKTDILEYAKKIEDEMLKLKEKLDSKLQEKIEKFKKEISEYNFVGESAEELKNNIDKFLEEIPNIPPKQAEKIIDNLYQKLDGLKMKAIEEKFKNGIIPFKDTDDNQWFTSDVSNAFINGIIGGYKDSNGNSLGEFRPANKVRVSEILKMALANAGLKETSGTPNIKSAINHWAQGWIKTAEDINMTLDSSEDINREATRGEVVRWIIESFDIVPPSAENSSFSDVTSADKNFDYIEYAKEMGIISGDGDTGKFRPNDNIIRAEVAKILQKAREVFSK